MKTKHSSRSSDTPNPFVAQHQADVIGLLSGWDRLRFKASLPPLYCPRTRNEDKLARAIARGLTVREKMAAAEGGSLSAEETARHLGLTKQSVLNLYHAGKMLGWRTEKQSAVRFPAWQFKENQRLPGLDEVLSKLNCGGVLDDWGKIGFFLQAHGLLNNRRPLDFLRENKLEAVLKAAEAYVQ